MRTQKKSSQRFNRN